MNFKTPRRIGTLSNGKNLYEVPEGTQREAKVLTDRRGGKNLSQEDSSSTDEDSSVEATQEITMGVEEDDDKEKIFRQECLDWLALNGKALFALEVSKFLVKERKLNATKRTQTLSKSGLLV